MRFTANELKSIEATMSKLENVANTVWDRSSTDGANARAIAFIISEMRLCASLVASDIPTYSASCELRQTVGVRFPFQQITAPRRKKMYADVDLRSSTIFPSPHH